MPPIATVPVQAEGVGLIEIELGFVILLSIAAAIAILIRRIRFPYTVALVIAGLGLAFFPDFLGIPISSSLILAFLVPPLIFEATLKIEWDVLRSDLVPILLLAVFGTLIGTTIVAAIVGRLVDVPLGPAVAFGALISATDPVAVLAFFRRLGVGKRLAVLVEGESLFNDAVAIVLFGLALEMVGSGPVASFDLMDAVLEFLTVALMGLGVGVVLGYVVSHIVLARVDDHLVEAATTLALAFGSYVVAEQLGWSGILAVVAAGLVVGNVGFHNISPTTKLMIESFWEFMAFVTNSLVFLLIGLRIEIVKFAAYLLPVSVAVLAILVSRAGVVYSLTALHQAAGARRPVPIDHRHVMFWGGLRGAISLALALTLTDAVVGAGTGEKLQFMTFGVVLFTLVVQGLTIETVIKRLGLSVRPQQVVEQQRRQAMIYAGRAGRRELDRLRDDGIIAGDVWRAMSEVYDEEIGARNLRLREHLDVWQELEQEMVLQARQDVLRAERTAIADAARRGLIGEDVVDDLIRTIDDRVAALELIRERGNLSTSADDGAAFHTGEEGTA